MATEIKTKNLCLSKKDINQITLLAVLENALGSSIYRIAFASVIFLQNKTK